jgi:GAF domain
VNSELRRLLVLKSYLLLDAEKEEAFDRLTEEACQFYNVPTSLISLIDLGRQFLFSNTGAANGVRETTRTVAFCSHTILAKSGICVVNDCTKDPRFQNNELVTEGPKLRFYAGAPLISPEGYKLGTFCVEGPDPRPQGLTQEEQDKLKEYAAKTMDLMVARRKKILEKSTAFNLPSNEPLRKHAAVSTNLGGILYEHGEYVTAMRLFQESVQTLMHVEEDASSVSLPSTERQEAFSNLLVELSNDSIVNSAVEVNVCIAKVKEFFDSIDGQSPQVTVSLTGPIQSIPGLFSATSKLKSIAAHRHFHGLIFAEPFKVSLEKDSYTGDLRTRPIDDRSFVIPLEQCSKATLFNMGLIHYHWGSPDSAVQFFDLAASLSQQHDALSFDPVILACLNNMAQIHLQHGRPMQ